MDTNVVRMRNNLHEKTKLLQILNHCLSCLVAIHAIVLASRAVDRCIVMHDTDLRQVVATTNLEIVRVMCRGDLYASGTELLVYIGVSDNRNLTVGQRKFEHLADKILVAIIIRIYCNCGIAEQSLRTGCCDLNKSVFLANDRVVDVPEKAVLFLMLNLCVRDRSLAYRTPVDDSRTLVDISFFVKFDENFLNRLGTALIHRETFAVPVSGRAELVELVDDAGAVYLLPVPACLKELVTSEIVLVNAFAL